MPRYCRYTEMLDKKYIIQGQGKERGEGMEVIKRVK